MTGPQLRATLDTGETYDDPSEDALFVLLEDLAAHRALFVVVEPVHAPDEQTYVQAVRFDDGTFQVERRLGSPQTHETVTRLQLRPAHALLTQWVFALPCPLWEDGS